MSDLEQDGASFESAEIPPEVPVTTETADTDKAPPEPEVKTVKFDEDQQAEVDKIAARLTFKRREAERETEKFKREAEELRKQIPQQARPVVPVLPDALTVNDDVFKQQLATRDEAIRQAAAYDAQERFRQEQLQSSERVRQQAQHEELQKQAQTYSARATQLGLKPEELQAAGKMVGDFGIDSDIAQMILNDDHGPLIVKYLASNLQELDDLSKLPVTQQAVRIATLIKTKAASLKPRVSSAPDPLKPVRGGGMPPADFGPKGATYE